MRNLIFRPTRLNHFQQPRLEMSDFFKEVDDIFREWRPAVADDKTSAAWFNPATDVVETDKEYKIHVDLPGLKEKDVKLNIEGNVLTLSGTREERKEESGDKYHRTERMFGSFERRFSIPDNVDVDKVEAQFKDGVLDVKMPKLETKKTVNIQIKS